MAEIIPFRGVLYDPARAGPVDRLIAPPYDVISPAERSALAAKSPHNFVRLILPEGEGDEKYSRAANLLADWQRQGVLRRDDKPALYRYHQTFSALGRSSPAKGSSVASASAATTRESSSRTSGRSRGRSSIG